MTNKYYPNLWQLFLNVADNNSDSVSISYSNQNYSFGQTTSRAIEIASALKNTGVRKGDIVGIFHDKSFDGFCLMIACLSIGAPYVNLDSKTPTERFRKIIKTCNPKLIISLLEEDLDHLNEEKFLISRLDDLNNCSDVIHSPTVGGNDAAYLMFTSGSTGVPKAAVISHGALLNFISWSKERFEVKSSDRFTNVNPLYFDNSVFDFYASLFNGATLCPTPTELLQKPVELVKWANSINCTIWFSVPSLLVYLLTLRALNSDNKISSLRLIVFGGEGFPKKKLHELFELFSPATKLENVYGPTETTCICSAHTITDDDFIDMLKLATLGKMAPNFDYFIDSSDNNENIGELILIGPQVCMGYYNSPQQTDSVFIQNPKHSKYRDLAYRTGDLIELDKEGNFHFLGRKDFQIKHMGYRIELEEIETAASSLSDIHETAVTYQKLDNGMGRIILHYSSAGTLDNSFINQKLKRMLPAYMMPQKIVRHEFLPKNANGKIDRKVLQ